jgi:hypothetical protein
MSIFKKKIPAAAQGAGLGSNPYLNGREEWLERYGSYISRATQWRMAAFLCLILTGLSLTGNVIQARQVKTVPYIIEVDSLGKIGAVTRADAASATPKRLIQASVASCVSDWRTVTADVELQRKMIERLSFFMAGSAKGVLRPGKLRRGDDGSPGLSSPPCFPTHRTHSLCRFSVFRRAAATGGAQTGQGRQGSGMGHNRPGRQGHSAGL